MPYLRKSALCVLASCISSGRSWGKLVTASRVHKAQKPRSTRRTKNRIKRVTARNTKNYTYSLSLMLQVQGLRCSSLNLLLVLRLLHDFLERVALDRYNRFCAIEMPVKTSVPRMSN